MIAVIDYKAGNAPSVLRAVERLGRAAAPARRPRDLAGASRVILPGVGSAAATMESLAAMDMIGPLEEAVLHRKTPFLGICVGLQILFGHSEEGDVPCLGWLKGRVVRFDASRVRVPQMGWNRVRFTPGVLGGVPEGFFYFVNSYHAMPEDESDRWGVADYGGPFTAAVRRENIYATQFHVEKSGETGLALLDAFLRPGKEGGPC